MPSIQYYLLRLYLSSLQRKQNKHSGNKIILRRKLMDKVANRFSIPKEFTIERVSANAIPSEKVTIKDRKALGTILYFHGGAYVAGSLKSHRHLASALAKETGYDILNVDYRLAPEHPFPAAISDALNAYQWLLTQKKANDILVAGDSAGGGLALSLLLKLKEEGISLPKAAILLAPWVDLRANIQFDHTRIKRDVILTPSILEESAAIYAHQNDRENVFISPALGDFTGLPPVLIQVGGHDLLWEEGRALAEHMQASGVKVYLYDWPKMLHVWQFFVGTLPEAKKAITEIAGFIKVISTSP